MKEPTKKQIQVFQDAVLEILRRFGFKERDSDLYEYEVQTIAGPLHVAIQEDWLACRFDDVPLAKLKAPDQSRLNPFSGKWNWDNGHADLPYFSKVLGMLVPEPVPNPELRAIPKQF